MAQYLAAKDEHPDALLFFRMGDFYELFFDDARRASEALDIVLTSRSKGDDRIPMAGVPVRALDSYLKRLVEMGFKVAICEQVQDPKDAKGVVERRVVRVVTPGTLTEDDLLQGARANFLAAVAVRGDRAGLAWCELSTGAFVVAECPVARLTDELTRIDPAELLIPDDDAELRASLAQARAAITRRAPHDFGPTTARQTLTRFFRTSTLEGFGLEGGAGEPLRLATGAAGALVVYLEETQLDTLPHIRRIEVQRDGDLMLLDRATRASLELVDTIRGDGAGTPLVRIVDETRTPMGARLLREWLLAPLARLEPVLLRQAAVAELFGEPRRTAALHDALGGVLDLQRLTTRISCGRANARDLVALRASLARLPRVLEGLAGVTAERLAWLVAHLDPLSDVTADVAATLIDEPPTTLRDGGLIAEGCNEELDELRLLARDSRQWMADYQARESARLGIGNLRVGFNRVFGYYIEITHGNRDVPLPPDYVRKQTTKNAERYVTDELKTFETKVLKAEETSKQLEYDLFDALRQRVAAQVERLQATAAIVAELDVLVGLAVVAKNRGYCRPLVDDGRTLRIEDGRHPVIEATHAAGTFVPNDTDLAPPARQLVLLTGPNMAGKSTFIRQNALIVLLAQIGSFVPARTAHIGLVDRVFTRVGAADDISRGASTFMVEMVETANILNNATERSLVVLDEVGRGTSTFDGLALAWAIAEDLHDRIGCRALFATHYHQITSLAGDAKGVVNQRVAVKEWGDEIVFLHRIEDGATDRSYGLHVGRLAGIPAAVLERARQVLERLEDEGEVIHERLAGPKVRGRPAEPRQLELFQAPRDELRDRLLDLDVDGLAPRQALELLAALQAELRGE
ncbi:MAG: DNA mismatch repair protein MutS [Planctomycetes bacterium]|nr:DNA mismatch repair protein MutS [Planctomycetota bacterium]